MNVIFILCDTLRRDHCNPYTGGGPRALNECWNPEQPGWAVATPNMQRLADRGTVFTNCYAGSTPCMPARRDVHTGRLEFLERGWGPLEEWDLDLASQVSNTGRFPHVKGLEQLKKSGGKVSQLVTDHMCLWSRGSGNYHMAFTGFEFVRGHQWDNYITDPAQRDSIGIMPGDYDRDGWYDRHALNSHRIRKEKGEDGWFAHQVFERSADWLRRNHTHEDFYLHIDCFDPHEPWDPPRELVEQFMPGAYDVPELTCHPPYVDWRKHGLTEEQFNSYRARYAAMCVMVDRALGKLLDAMDETDLWKNTMVIFTTDHGTWNGERGRIGKLGTHQFDGGSHIPFIIAHPEVGHGETRDQLVQLVDTYPTTLAAVGRPMPEMPDGRTMHGINLLPVLEDATTPTREYAVTGMFGQSVSITDGRWMLHQSPIRENKPLNWYGYQASDFVGAGALGPVVDGRRAVASHAWRGEVTWLSDKAADPNEYENLAEANPAKLREMQAALAATLHALKAPREQLQRLGIDCAAG